MKKTSKQLESILAVHMHTTPTPAVSPFNEEQKQQVSPPPEKEFRITISVPPSIKLQFKQRMASSPEETVRSIVLRALKHNGFHVDEDQIKDKRTKTQF